MERFEMIDRPPRNRRTLSDPDLDQQDKGLEDALLATLGQRAIKVPLAQFHSSPAKGRLWSQGFSVMHRVLPGRQFVAAWVELGVLR